MSRFAKSQYSKLSKVLPTEKFPTVWKVFCRRMENFMCMFCQSLHIISTKVNTGPLWTFSTFSSKGLDMEIKRTFLSTQGQFDERTLGLRPQGGSLCQNNIRFGLSFRPGGHLRIHDREGIREYKYEISKCVTRIRTIMIALAPASLWVPICLEISLGSLYGQSFRLEYLAQFVLFSTPHS